jgi:hypothetical protein
MLITISESFVFIWQPRKQIESLKFPGFPETPKNSNHKCPGKPFSHFHSDQCFSDTAAMFLVPTNRWVLEDSSQRPENPSIEDLEASWHFPVLWNCNELILRPRRIVRFFGSLLVFLIAFPALFSFYFWIFLNLKKIFKNQNKNKQTVLIACKLRGGNNAIHCSISKKR